MRRLTLLNRQQPWNLQIMWRLGSGFESPRGHTKAMSDMSWKFKTLGKVSLLLVPRVPLPLGQSSLKKQKRSIPPSEPKLFNPAIRETHCNPNDNPDDPMNTIPSEDSITPENYFVHDGNHFKHGLIVRSYNIHSLSTVAVSIQSKTFTHFWMSGHPLILASKLPKLIEWILKKAKRF